MWWRHSEHGAVSGRGCAPSNPMHRREQQWWARASARSECGHAVVIRHKSPIKSSASGRERGGEFIHYRAHSSVILRTYNRECSNFRCLCTFAMEPMHALAWNAMPERRQISKGEGIWGIIINKYMYFYIYIYIYIYMTGSQIEGSGMHRWRRHTKKGATSDCSGFIMMYYKYKKWKTKRQKGKRWCKRISRLSMRFGVPALGCTWSVTRHLHHAIQPG